MTRNAVGELASRDADRVLAHCLDAFGHALDIWPRVFVMDANAASSADLKAFKQAVADIKAEIVEVSLLSFNWNSINLHTFS